MRPQFVIGLALFLSACGERSQADGDGQGSTTPPYVRAEAPPPTTPRVQPVRVGEQGPAFAACAARGGVRERVTAGPVPVRAAPYAEEEAIDSLAVGAQFFICSRTYDQRWFGIVYDEGGEASDRCGVSAPTPRGNYAGPCAAGWVPSASVRLISGIPHQMTAGPDEPSGG